MEAEFIIESSGVIPLEKYALISKRTFPETLLRAGKGTIRRVVRITPPFRDGEGDAEARTRGYRVIHRDLMNVFTPVKFKGKRREQYSGADVRQIHTRHLKAKRFGKPMRSDKGRQYYHVRYQYVSLLEDVLRSHVGLMPAGWMPAVEALKVSVPQWIARHGTGRGLYRADLTGEAMYIEAVAGGVAPWIAPELARRIRYALEYQANAMKREIEFLTMRDARASGLHVA